MGILDELIEKKDLRAYIAMRIAMIRMEIKNNLKKLPEDKKEKMLNRASGRIRELESMKKTIHNNKVKEQSKMLFAKCKNELGETHE